MLWINQKHRPKMKFNFSKVQNFGKVGGKQKKPSGINPNGFFLFILKSKAKAILNIKI